MLPPNHTLLMTQGMVGLAPSIGLSTLAPKQVAIGLTQRVAIPIGCWPYQGLLLFGYSLPHWYKLALLLEWHWRCWPEHHWLVPPKWSEVVGSWLPSLNALGPHPHLGHLLGNLGRGSADQTSKQLSLPSAHV